MMRDRLYSTLGALLPVFATLAALLVGALFLLALGVNPGTAYSALFQGAFGSWNAFAETLVKAVPLLLVGLGICIAYRGSVTNIGGEGQIIIGGSLLPDVFWQLGASTDGSKKTAISPTASFSGVVRENVPVYAQEIEKRTSPDGISTW